MASAAVDGHLRSFVVTLFDEFGNVDTADSNEVALYETTDGMNVQSIRFDEELEAYVVEYTAESCPGSLDFSVLVNSERIDDTVYSIPCIADDPSGEHSVATSRSAGPVGNVAMLNAGETDEVYVALIDARGTRFHTRSNR
jgi:hypothetical protein